MNKILRKEQSHQAFKEWLKASEIKMRGEIIQKKIELHEKRERDEEKKKAKENMKVMAKIAYKEWKETKAEQARH